MKFIVCKSDLARFMNAARWIWIFYEFSLFGERCAAFLTYFFFNISLPFFFHSKVDFPMVARELGNWCDWSRRLGGKIWWKFALFVLRRGSVKGNSPSGCQHYHLHRHFTAFILSLTDSFLFFLFVQREICLALQCHCIRHGSRECKGTERFSKHLHSFNVIKYWRHVVCN